MNDEQAATGTDTQVTPENEGTGEPEQTMDELLAQVDSETQPEPAKQEPMEPKAAPLDSARLDRVESFMEAQQQKEATSQFDKAVASAVTRAKDDDVLSGFSDSMIEGSLRLKASKDKRISQAFENQDRDPVTWDKVLGKLIHEIREEQEAKPVPELTNAREAARASVRTHSSNPDPEPVDTSKMGHAQFMRHSDGVAAKGG